jgi:signal transduction histidine kinase
MAILILLILEVPLAVLAQRFEHDLATNQAERDANGLAAVATEDIELSNSAALRVLVSRYELRTGGEVTVVGPHGAVMAASSSDAHADSQNEWKNLADRALQGQSSTMFTSDEGRPFAVASVPIASDGGSLGAVVLGTPAGFTEDRIHDIWLALALFAVGAMVISAVVGIILARSMSLPLGRLEWAVDRLGEGDLAVRARDREGPPEIRSLARRFNQMAGRLDELVTAQKRFVADASHQLRSPLTALRLRIENLEAAADDSSSEAISAVGREVFRLSRLVDGLLTLGRADQETVERREIDISEVIDERCESWSALASERSIELVHDARPGSATCRLIPGDLDQILDNLLANAFEVSPANGQIGVRLSGSEGNHAEIHVIDQGPGMSLEDRRRAFDRFWQGPERPSGHSGLGLAIVRQLAVRNGLGVELRQAEPTGLDAVVHLPGA